MHLVITNDTVPSDILPHVVRDVESCAVDLMLAVRQATTVSRALEIWKLARLLESEIGAVASAALDRADQVCGS